jgi:hypothetical protein
MAGRACLTDLEPYAVFKEVTKLSTIKIIISQVFCCRGACQQNCDMSMFIHLN